MRLFKTWYVQLALFLAGFAALLCAADFVLVPLRARDLVCAYDFAHTQDVKIVAIGNSLCTEQIDPYQLEQTTGRRAINFGITAAKAQSLPAMAAETFTHHRPEALLVVYEPNWNIMVKEDSAVMAKLSPLLSTYGNRMRYLLDRLEYSIDDFNRVFLWRMGMECSLRQIAERVQYKLGIRQKEIYENTLRDINRDREIYKGRGYSVVHVKRDQDSLMRAAREVRAEEEKPLDGEVADCFRRVKALCDQHDCRMVVVTPPLTRDNVLADGETRAAMNAMEAFCREENIAYLNFTYAQGRSMPDLTGTYRDGYNHLDDEGMRLFNASFAQTIKVFLDGEDVSDRLMTGAEWMASIDRVTNVWMTRETQGGRHVYTAHALCGTAVSCAYRFSLMDADGRETVLQDYDGNNRISVDIQQGKRLRVDVKNLERPDQPALPCFYE